MLSTREIELYRDKGYLVFERLIHGETLEHHVNVLRDAVDRSKDIPGDAHWTFELDENGVERPEHMLHKIQGVCVAVPEILELAREPAIVDKVETLLGPEIDVFGTKFFPLLPGGGTSTHWHQDNFYFDTWADDIVTCGIYLEDTTRENGCLWYVPDSHRWPLLPITGLAGGMDAIREVLDDEQLAQFDARVPIELKAGQASFHHPLMVHGSYENKTDRPRRAMVLNVVRDGVQSDSNEPLLDGVDVIPKGEPLGGRFFPLLMTP